MKKLLSIFMVLFAVAAFSNKLAAQNYTLDNQIPVGGILVTASYCSNTATATSGTSATTANTCLGTMTCQVKFDLNGCIFTVNLVPCPVYGNDYVYTTSVTTGCATYPTLKFDFFYDGFTDDIIITIK